MTLTEEIELGSDAEKFGVIYDSNDLKETKNKVNNIKNSIEALKSRLNDLNVEQSIIENCNESIPCLLKLIDEQYTLILTKKFEKFNKDEELKKRKQNNLEIT